MKSHMWLYADVLRDVRFMPYTAYPTMCGKESKIIVTRDEVQCKICRKYYDEAMERRYGDEYQAPERRHG